MSRNLIIDTNLLLLLVIGAVEEGKYISKSKRLKAFDISDYNKILKIMSDFDKVFITPYIATEISNLIDLKGQARILAYEVARNLFSEFEEISVNLNKDCESNFFLKFGITDNSLIKLVSDYCILTSDYRMLKPLFKGNENNVIPYYKN